MPDKLKELLRNVRNDADNKILNGAVDNKDILRLQLAQLNLLERVVDISLECPARKDWETARPKVSGIIWDIVKLVVVAVLSAAVVSGGLFHIGG